MNDRKTQFSECRRYRYALWREWATPDLLTAQTIMQIPSSYLMVIGLNPSTADETQDDPTIRRCIDFAKRWGFGALCMTNLFAWRDTKPENMKRAANPVGEANHHHILQCADGAARVLGAWGKHGSFMQQDLNAFRWVTSIGKDIYCLRKNKDGSPQHPLYVPADTIPFIWTP